MHQMGTIMKGNGGAGITGKARKIMQYRQVLERERVRDLARLEEFRAQSGIVATASAAVGGIGSLAATSGDTIISNIPSVNYLMTSTLELGAGVYDDVAKMDNERLKREVEEVPDVIFSMVPLIDPARFIMPLGVGGMAGAVNTAAAAIATADINIAVNKPASEDTITRFVDFIKKRGVVRLSNVYQETYANGKMATGLGDFIRGCYFVLQFCQWITSKDYGVILSGGVVINHQIRGILGESSSGMDVRGGGTIVAFSNQNWRTTIFAGDGTFKDELGGPGHLDVFMEYVIRSAVVRGDTAYIYTISYPIWGISSDLRKIVSRAFVGGNDIMEYVSKAKVGLGLNRKYIVIHIRCGDRFLIGGGVGEITGAGEGDGRFNEGYMIRLLDAIHKLGLDSRMTDILLLADNNAVKDRIIRRFPFMRAMKKEIGHLGEGQPQAIERMKNTMLDFYLLSEAVGVYAFTAYAHGTGFSRWCAATYGIPYRCWYIGGKF